MLRPRRIPCLIALLLAVVAILLGVPRAAHPASRQDAAGQPIAAITLAARSPAATGGLCSVPGIGDIGGLLGFCSLGSSGLTGDLNNIASFRCRVLSRQPGIDSAARPVLPGPQNGTP
jgi:hypothetical protein